MTKTRFETVYPGVKSHFSGLTTQDSGLTTQNYPKARPAMEFAKA